MKSFSASRVAMVAMCSLASLAIGCSSSGRAPESEKAVESMKDVREQLDTAKAKVTRVNTSLDQLSSGGDLQKSFSTYSDALDDLQSAVEDAKKRGEDMRDRRKAYLDKWQSEAGEVQNAEIQQSLEARRQRVAAEFDKIRSLADDIRAAYHPYMQDCQDIKKALAVDLTAAGAQGLAPVMAKAKGEGATVIAKLDALNSEMDSVIGKMSPSGAAK